MTTTDLPALRRWKPRRQALLLGQLGLFMAVPWVARSGVSLLRFDVPTLRLHVGFSELFIGEFFVLLLALLCLTALFLWATLVFGRLWCGFACPQSVLCTLTDFVAQRRRATLRQLLDSAGVILLSAVVSMVSLWYFVAPPQFFWRLAHGALGPWLLWPWLGITLLLVGDLLWLRERGFCAKICPYAMLQSVLLDKHSLVIAYDKPRGESDCIDDGACVRVCPVAIDVRQGSQKECMGCTACIDACTKVLRPRRKPTLIDYVWGQPDAKPRYGRPAALVLAALGLGAGVTTTMAALTRHPLDVQVSATAGVAPRLTAEGKLLNGFDLALESHARQPLQLVLGASYQGQEVDLRPAAAALLPGEHKRIRLLVQVPLVAGESLGELQLAVGAVGEPAAEQVVRVRLQGP